jgi:hypothetical protein
MIERGRSFHTEDGAISKQEIHKVLFLEKPFGGGVVMREIS